MMDLRTIAQALGGEVAPRGEVKFPPPGHSRIDRSGSLRLDPRAPDGFLIVTRSPADDPLHVKDWVRQQLGWKREQPVRETQARTRTVAPAPGLSNAERTARALAIWREAQDPRETIVETYLRSRGVPLPGEAAGGAIRFHPDCPFAAGQRTPAMVALVRDVITNEAKAIHRTALDREGRKRVVAGHDRLSLGPVGGGAIKLTPDENVTLCLGVGEGIESALSLRRLPEFGRSPVWSLLSAGSLASLPALAGVEAIWIAVDLDEAGVGAARAVTGRWVDAGAEAFQVRPPVVGTDLNDSFRRRADA